MISTVQEATLVDALVSELKNPSPFGQPIIIEDWLHGDDFRLYVIWDKWKSLTRKKISTIIFDAYYEVSPKEALKLCNVHGMTVKEGWAAGWLPFGIEPRRSREGDPTSDEYDEILLEVGASRIKGIDLPQLRFHTQWEAENTMEYFESRIPNSRWLITLEYHK